MRTRLAGKKKKKQSTDANHPRQRGIHGRGQFLLRKKIKGVSVSEAANEVTTPTSRSHGD